MLRILSLVSFLVVLAAAGQPSTALAAGPLEEVRANVDVIFSILQNKDASLDERREKVYSRVRKWFDFKIMSRGVLASNWEKASAEEQERFTTLFTELLETTYCQRINNFTGERVEFLDERVAGKRAEVDTIVYIANDEILITYKLFLKGSRWLVYDVIIDGVSLIKNYRDSYREFVSKEGMEALLARMQERIKSCRLSQRDGG